jgi:hypothetical protein
MACHLHNARGCTLASRAREIIFFVIVDKLLLARL